MRDLIPMTKDEIYERILSIISERAEHITRGDKYRLRLSDCLLEHYLDCLLELD